MTKEEFIKWAQKRGWTLDRFGHLQKTTADSKGNYHKARFKLQPTSVRYEIQVVHPATEYSPKSTEWFRLRSGYYKDLSISPEGKLRGLKL